MQIVAANPGVRMQALASEFNVSIETIRRDFDQLSEAGRLNRTFGGAVLVQTREAELSRRVMMMVRERSSIALKIASMVEDHDTLMIGAGATTWFVAKELARSKRHLSVVTHSMDVATALSANPTHTVLLPPGQYSDEERLVYGSETVAYLANYSASKAILGASGVSTAGCSNVEVNAGMVYKAMAGQCTEVLVGADHSKFNIGALFTFLKWAPNVNLITDQPPPESMIKAIEREEARWLLSADSAPT